MEFKEELEEMLKYILDKSDDIVCKIITGSACDSPIITHKDDVYKFDSYGVVPKNYREWDSVGGYGMAGSFGYTTNILVVYKSCKSLNKQSGCVALISKEVYSKLIDNGYKVELVNFGFK